MLKVGDDKASWRGSLVSLKNRFRDVDTRSFVLRDCEGGSGNKPLINTDAYMYYSSGQLNNDYPAKLQQPDEENDCTVNSHANTPMLGSSLTLTVSLDGSSDYIDKVSVNGDKQTTKNVPNKFTPPDGGYGWVVVLASFLIQGVTGSIGYIHGMLYPEFLAAFDAGGVTTAWVSSIQVAVWFIGAMIAGPMVQTIGSRNVCMIGSVVIAVSILLTAAAKHIAMLYIFYGFATGIGMSFIFFPAVIVVQQYFVKKRSIAVAIANAGVSFGGFAMPPLCDFLLQTFGWRGNMIIMAGIALNVLVISCAFRPIGKKNIPKKNTVTEDNDIESQVEKPKLQPLKVPEIKIDKAKLSERRESVSLPSSPMLHRMKPAEPLTKILGKKLIEEKISNQYPFPKVTQDKKELSEKSELTDEEKPFIKHTGPNAKAEESQNSHKKELNIKSIYQQSQLKAFLKRLTDFSLLKNPNMVFDMFAYGCFSFGFIVPSMFLPLKAYQLDIPHPKPTFLISIIGISDVLGRFVTGFMGQILGQRRLIHYMLSMLVGGMMTASSSLIHTFEGLAIYACIFGLCTGMARAYSSIVLTDMLGLNNLPKAYGFKLFLNGFTVLGSAPFAAFIMESTNSVDISFLVIGIVQGMGGVLIFILLILRRCGCAPVRTSWID